MEKVRADTIGTSRKSPRAYQAIGTSHPKYQTDDGAARRPFGHNALLAEEQPARVGPRTAPITGAEIREPAEPFPTGRKCKGKI